LAVSGPLEEAQADGIGSSGSAEGTPLVASIVQSGDLLSAGISDVAPDEPAYAELPVLDRPEPEVVIVFVPVPVFARGERELEVTSASINQDPADLADGSEDVHAETAPFADAGSLEDPYETPAALTSVPASRGGLNSTGTVSLKTYPDESGPAWRRVFAFESE
jgi:hypothetical protein